MTPLNTTPIFDGVQVTARDASGNPTQYTAWFGYKNPNAYSVSIPAGTTTSSANYLQRTLAGGATQFETTQPVKFAPGTWHFLWNVTFTPQESVKWGLNSNVITASAASLITTEGPSGAVGYVSTARPHAYDLNGNTLNDGLRAYTWDAENRPIKIVQEGTTYEFNYDGLGRRLKEKVNGVLKKQWIWDGDELVEERDGSNNTTRKFFSQGAQINGANYYYTRDHLGSVIGIYDSTGNVKARYAYDAYGMRTIPLPGAPASNFAFTGHYIHSTNLLLTRHRLYDPETAHWLSRDPLGEDGGINLYGYVGNNPVNAIDPDGLLTVYVHGTWSNGVDAFPGNFVQNVNQYFGDNKSFKFEWSGGNADTDRNQAGLDLASILRNYHQRNPCEPIRVVAHSHGGNVALLASQQSGTHIDELVTLGTPILSRYTRGAGIVNWNNIYSTDDNVQTLPRNAGRTSSTANSNIRLSGFGHSDLHTVPAWNAAFSPPPIP